MDGSPRISIDSKIHNRDAAILAADEDGILNTAHDVDDYKKQEELASWIGDILDEPLTADTLFDDLNNGVRLLYLAKSVQLIKCNHLQDANCGKAVENLKPDDYTNTGRLLPKRASQLAKQRSNIAKFLEWCSDIGVPRITLFETEDLTQRKNLRQVTTCLFYVSKIASRFGIEPPSSVKKEVKVEQENAETDDELNDSLAMLPSTARSQNDFVLENKMTNEFFEANPRLDNQIETIDEGNSDKHVDITKSFDDIFPYVKYQRSASPIASDTDEEEDEMFRSDEQLNHTDPPKYPPNADCDDIRIVKEDNEFIFRPLQDPATHGIKRLHPSQNERKSPPRIIIPRYKESRLPSDDSLSNEIGIYQRHSFDDSPDLMFCESPLPDASYYDLELRQPPLSRDDAYMYFPSLHEIKEHTRGSPFSLPRVLADDVVDKCRTNDSSSEDVVSEELSYDFEEKKTYLEDVTGSDKLQTKAVFDPVTDEIMIDFPPYFEFSDFPKHYPIIPPPQEYIVAPVKDDALYSVPNKPSRTRSREQNRNPAFEMEIVDPRERPTTGYHSLDTNYVRRWRNGSNPHATSASSAMARAMSETQKNEIGTQTHVTFTDGVERILRGSDERAGASSGRHPRETIVYKTQQQGSLPTENDDISITQASDLEVSRTARWGSSSSGTRTRSTLKNVDSVADPDAIRRGVLRRTSSRISQQLRKAAFAAKKYTKRTVVVAVLMVLALTALCAMLVVFLSR